jgi:hypothetical protein
MLFGDRLPFDGLLFLPETVPSFYRLPGLPALPFIAKIPCSCIPNILYSPIVFQILTGIDIHPFCTGLYTFSIANGPVLQDLVPHIHILQRNSQVAIAAKLYHLLQVVYFFARHPYQVIVDGSLHLHS